MTQRMTTAVGAGLLVGTISGLVLMAAPAAVADTDTGSRSATSSSSAPANKASAGETRSKSPGKKGKSAESRAARDTDPTKKTGSKRPTPADDSRSTTRIGKRSAPPVARTGEALDTRSDAAESDQSPSNTPSTHDTSGQSDTTPPSTAGPAPDAAEPPAEPAPDAAESPAAPETDAPTTPEPAEPEAASTVEIEASAPAVEATSALPQPDGAETQRVAAGPEPAGRVKAETEAQPRATIPAPPADTAETAPSTTESGEESSGALLAAPVTEAETVTTASTKTAVAEQSTVTTIAAAATAPSTRRPSIVNVIGSIVVNLLVGLVQLIDGPPALPAGSTVTVRTSSLTLPIGTGRNVQADWYFPEEVDDSTRFIYLQHGFLASAPMYSYTAARLAEQTNSIVVAPSLSSNFFDINAEWVGGSTMQRAVAELFLGDRDALTASAAAAGYTGVLPQTFVLVGHSLGGTLVTATAGYLADQNATEHLAGVVILDGVEPKGSHAINDAMGKLTGEHHVPVYLISSQRYAWSAYGDMADKLMAARPTEFNGVGLTDGMHIDYMEGGNTFLQYAEYLIAGFSHRYNTDAAVIIAAGWVNDLFAGTTNGIYGDPLQSIAIPTPAGEATAVVLPLGPAGPSPRGPILDPLVAGLLNYLGEYHGVYEPLLPRAVAA